MSTDKPQPQFSKRGDLAAEQRRLRQAEALRANLSRRKDQARSRADDDPPPAPAQDAAPDQD